MRNTGPGGVPRTGSSENAFLAAVPSGPAVFFGKPTASGGRRLKATAKTSGLRNSKEIKFTQTLT